MQSKRTRVVKIQAVSSFWGHWVKEYGFVLVSLYIEIANVCF